MSNDEFPQHSKGNKVKIYTVTSPNGRKKTFTVSYDENISDSGFGTAEIKMPPKKKLTHKKSFLEKIFPRKSVEDDSYAEFNPTANSTQIQTLETINENVNGSNNTATASSNDNIQEDEIQEDFTIVESHGVSIKIPNKLLGKLQIKETASRLNISIIKRESEENLLTYYEASSSNVPPLSDLCERDNSNSVVLAHTGKPTANESGWYQPRTAYIYDD